jgi:hypothetical protein
VIYLIFRNNLNVFWEFTMVLTTNQGAGSPKVVRSPPRANFLPINCRAPKVLNKVLNNTKFPRFSTNCKKESERPNI